MTPGPGASSGGSICTATVTTGIEDLSGNPLAANKAWPSKSGNPTSAEFGYACRVGDSLSPSQ